MTSRKPWPRIWQEKLRPSSDEPRRAAIVGVGSELNGDDIAGVLVARALLPLAESHEHLLVIDAGPAPENVTGVLRRFMPEVILFVDAARMGGTPGEVRWLDWQDITGVSASTHTLPLSIVAQYLMHELGAEVSLLGIQPVDVSPGADVSPAVEQAIDHIVDHLRAALD